MLESDGLTRDTLDYYFEMYTDAYDRYVEEPRHGNSEYAHDFALKVMELEAELEAKNNQHKDLIRRMDQAQLEVIRELERIGSRV